MNKILEYLLGLLICYGIAFAASSGIVGSWVMFWEYGWIWNETTVPPLVTIDIFFSNIVSIFIWSVILTPIIIILLYLFNSR